MNMKSCEEEEEKDNKETNPASLKQRVVSLLTRVFSRIGKFVKIFTKVYIHLHLFL